MFIHLFRILNLAWAAGVLAMLLVGFTDPDRSVMPASLLFWALYLLIALGTFFDLRAAWGLCVIQLVAIWVLMGVMVSDGSFSIVTGTRLNPTDDVTAFVLNSFIGILAPATVLITLLILAHSHVVWVFKDRWRESGRRRRRRRRTPATSPR